MSENLALLDFDDQQKAVLMPDHDGPFEFHAKAIFPFLTDLEITQFVRNHHGQQIGFFETITKTYAVYECRYHDEWITVAQAPLGAPAATQFLDFLIYFGVQKVISIGSCGVLNNMPENQFLVPTSALRDEGTSFHYVAKSNFIQLNKAVVNQIEGTLSTLALPFCEVKTWTTDGFFRETPNLVRKRKAQGCEVVEMECAALAACAQFRKVSFGQVFFTADSLSDLEKDEPRNWGLGAHEKSLTLAADLVTNLN